MTVSKKDLTKINKFKKSSVAILTYAVIDSNQLIVTTLNNGIQIQFTVNHDWNVTAGPVLVSIEEFVKLSRKLDIKEIYKSNKKAELVTGAGSFSFESPDFEDYIDLVTYATENKEEATFADVDGEVVIKLSDYMSNDDLRPAMCGVFLSAENNEYISTDGHRMEWQELPGGIESDEIIPAEVIKLMDKKELYRLSQGSKYSCLSSGGTQITWQRVVEQYPNYKSVIPSFNDAFIVSLNKKETLKAVEASSMGIGKERDLNFNLGEEVFFTSFDMDLEKDFKSKNLGSYKGEEMNIGFNTKYLLQALKRFPGETVKLSIVGARKPVLIGSNEIIMPVMLTGY